MSHLGISIDTTKRFWARLQRLLCSQSSPKDPHLHTLVYCWLGIAVIAPEHQNLARVVWFFWVAYPLSSCSWDQVRLCLASHFLNVFFSFFAAFPCSLWQRRIDAFSAFPALRFESRLHITVTRSAWVPHGSSWSSFWSWKTSFVMHWVYQKGQVWTIFGTRLSYWHRETADWELGD